MTTKFEIYRDGQRVTHFTPIAASAVGPESVPMPGEVHFKDGLLHLARPDDHAAGLSLLWDLGALGCYMMETTRLQPRDKAYNLNVELARFRLMKLVQKQEDWNLFDFPKAEKFSQRFREAQALLAEALSQLDDAPVASKLADESLNVGVELSEDLSRFHAELLINRRRATNGFVKHIFGCRINSAISNARYREAFPGHFDYAVVPTPWKQIQPQEGSFDTATLDEWVEFLSQKRIPIIAGPLIDLDESRVPDWMFIWEHDWDTLRELCYEYVQRIVQRYRKAVAVWNVTAGLHAHTAFALTFEQTIELTRLLITQLKTILPSARAAVTIRQSFGEYHARHGSTTAPMLYAEMVAQAGINFEAFGLEIEMGVPSPGRFTRDLFQISCMLDKFSTLGRPVFLTGVLAPSRNTPDASDQSEGKLDPSQGGRWHRPWDPQLQADWMEAVYRVALSKPFIESIAWGDLADIRPTFPGAGLLDESLKPKPSFERLKDLREKFHHTSRK